MSHEETAERLVRANNHRAMHGIPERAAVAAIAEALAAAHENGRREGLERAAEIAQAKADELQAKAGLFLASSPSREHRLKCSGEVGRVAEAIRQELGSADAAGSGGEEEPK